jgi:hypothetical protein
MPLSANVSPSSDRGENRRLIAPATPDIPPPVAPGKRSPRGVFKNPDYLEGSAIRADNAPLARRERGARGRLRRPARKERSSRDVPIAPSIATDLRTWARKTP